MELFQLSREAKTDLRSIAFFTESRWGKAQRNLYIKQLDDAFLTLAQNPGAGIPCDYIRAGYRKFPHASHIIFYKPCASATILVVRIYIKAWITTPSFNVTYLRFLQFKRGSSLAQSSVF